MGFENFGVVSFTSDAKVSPFVEYLEKGKVMTTRCKQCGKAYFPPKADCPRCLSDDVEWFEINESGTLKTYTVVHYGPTGFEDEAPYALGIAEFGSGLKILGRVSKALSPEVVKVGMKVKLVPVKLDNGNFIFEMNEP